MTANSEILDATIGHLVDLQGYSNRVARRVIALLNRVDSDLVEQVRRAVDRLPASQFTVERLERLLSTARQINAESFGRASDLLDSELQDLTAYELTWQSQALAAATPLQFTRVAPSEAYAAAMARPFQGRLLREWMAGLEADKAARVRDAVRIGYVEGETVDQMVRRLRGSRNLGFADGLLQANRRNVEAVVRTAVNHTANYANEAFAQANADVIKGYIYTATLDVRTTTLCASRDGNFYRLDQKKPALPAHINCRSRYTLQVKSLRDLGLDVDDFPESTRESMDGQVAESTTYEAWLRRQSIERQNEVLGVEKAKLFRDGNLPLTRFISPQGHEYTLAQLRERDARAFALAGIDG